MRWERPSRGAAAILTSMAAWLIVMPQLARATAVTAEEMAQARRWVATRFEDAGKAGKPELPFSFTYGGKPSAELFQGWQVKRNVRKLDGRAVSILNFLTHVSPAQKFPRPRTRVVTAAAAASYLTRCSAWFPWPTAANGARSRPNLNFLTPFSRAL